MTQIKNILKNFFTSGIEGNYEKEEYRKAVLINAFSLISIFSLIYYLIKGLGTASPFYLLALFFVLVLTGFNLIYLRKTKKIVLASNIIVFLMFCLATALYTIIGYKTTGLYWSYAFAPLAFFLTGRRLGLIYVSLLFVVIVIGFHVSLPNITSYPEYIHNRFYSTYFILNILIYLFELVRERNHHALKKAYQEIQYQNSEIQQQREEILAQTEQLEHANTKLQYLSLVASKTDSGVMILDADGNFEWINEGFTRLYGYNFEQFITEIGTNILQTSFNPEIRSTLEACLKNKKTVIYECPNKTCNGEEIWTQTTLTPVLDAENNIEKLVAIDTDISKLKTIEAELLQKEEEILVQSEELWQKNKDLEKLSIVASKTDSGVMILDANGNFEWVNEGFTRLYGYNFEQFTTEIGTNILQTSFNPEIRSTLEACLKNKKTVIYECPNKTCNGEEIWTQTTLTPVLDAENEIQKLIAVDTDISRLKNAETEIIKQNEKIMQQTERLRETHEKLLATNEILQFQKEELQTQKEKLENQNRNIRCSIEYALTIQQAILPMQADMNRYFELFTIFKPKDIVSGDFFWFTHHPAVNGLNEMLFFAVVDCTGHGVPGAFMSMIGDRMLNEIVNERKITEPAKILEILDENIRYTLKQQHTANKDGMDISLCKLEPLKTKKNQFDLTFAGAKRPLFYYRHAKQKLVSIQGDRRSIGGVVLKKTIPFTEKKTTIEANDILYLLTDGIIDQHAPNRKRFGTPRWIKTLESAVYLPIPQQKEIIEKSLEQYREKEEQRDDITVIGLKIRKLIDNNL